MEEVKVRSRTLTVRYENLWEGKAVHWHRVAEETAEGRKLLEELERAHKHFISTMNELGHQHPDVTPTLDEVKRIQAKVEQAGYDHYREVTGKEPIPHPYSFEMLSFPATTAGILDVLARATRLIQDLQEKHGEVHVVLEMSH